MKPSFDDDGSFFLKGGDVVEVSFMKLEFKV